MATAADVTTGIRDLIVHLHRGNSEQAGSIILDVARNLTEILGSGGDPESGEMQRAQQTMFAIEEVKILLAQADYSAAAIAARDAGSEWRERR